MKKFFNGILTSANNFYFDFITAKGLMRVHAPEENILIDGVPGSGKSHYFIKFILHQAAFRQYSGFVYDYEGDPTKDGSPILTRIAYSSMIQAKEHFIKENKLDDYKLNFAFINFTDMAKTERVNILSERYFSPQNVQMFIDNLATTLMKNLEPSWKEKTEYSVGIAIDYVGTVMYLLYKNHRGQNLNTLPHAISVCLSNSDTVFRWMESDSEIGKYTNPMFTAWKMGGAQQQQIADTVRSPLFKRSLQSLYKPYIYWVLSADNLSLDVSNKNKPTLLCVGNSPDLKEAISPAISVIASVVMSQMNKPDKQKSIICLDELPTIYLFDLDKFMATARKHLVSTILAVQDFTQLVRDYGDKSATTIRTLCGTYFQGKTGNNKTAEEVIKSLNNTVHNDFNLQERDITSQNSGHFFGKISNGEPPYLFTDFDPFHKVENFKNVDLPNFGVFIKTGDDKKDRDILEKLVDENFKRIEFEVEEMLKPFEAQEE